MGVVWAATDELLGRAVAVKEVVPPPGLTAEQAELTRTRSLREARAAARITSRSAVKVFDVVEEDGRPWIVMELLDARSLSDIITANGPLPPAKVAEIAGQLLEALTAAHASGVLHRDVKPSNVMIEDGGRVVLTDFGIAALDGDPSITTTGVLIGSAAYIAPERAHGEPASPASDLWSLGCTMFTALEGRPPFDRGGSMATLGAVLTEDPLRGVSAGPLSPVLEGLLRKDTRHRLSAEDTDRLLRTAVTAPTTPMRAGTPMPGAPLSGGTTSVLPVLPADSPVAPPPAPRVVPSRPPPRPAPSRPAAAPPAVSRPAPSRPEPVPPVGRARRRGAKVVLVALLAAVLALGAIVVGAILLSNGDGDPDQAAGPGGQQSVSSSTAAASSSSDPATETSRSEIEPTTIGGLSLPDGFRLHEDETGFSIAVPEDWVVTKDGPRTDFTEPGTGRFLRVDQTQDPQPDPVADWENQEASVSQRLTGYERIRIDPVVYRDYDSADWEFTWAPAEGEPLHVLNRNLITGPEQAYALYWSTPESEWEDSLELFQTFTNTFQPAE